MGPGNRESSSPAGRVPDHERAIIAAGGEASDLMDRTRRRVPGPVRSSGREFLAHPPYSRSGRGRRRRPPRPPAIGAEGHAIDRGLRARQRPKDAWVITFAKVNRPSCTAGGHASGPSGRSPGCGGIACPAIEANRHGGTKPCPGPTGCTRGTPDRCRKPKARVCPSGLSPITASWPGVRGAAKGPQLPLAGQVPDPDQAFVLRRRHDQVIPVIPVMILCSRRPRGGPGRRAGPRP